MFDYFLDFYVHRHFGPDFIITEGLFVLGVIIISNRIRWKLSGILEFLLRFVLLWTFTVLLDCLFMWFTRKIGYDGLFSRMMYTAMPLSMVLYFTFFSRYRWKTRVVEMIVYYTCFLLILGLSENIGFIMRERFSVGRMTLVVIIAGVLGVSSYLYIFNFDEYHFVPYFSIILILVFSVITFIARDTSVALPRENNLVLSSCLLVMEIFSYYLFYSVSWQYDDNVVKLLTRDRKHGAREMLLVSRSGYDNMHVVLHDVKNQFAALQTMLHQGEYAKAQEFLNEFELYASPAIEAVDCGNVVIDSALLAAKAKAEKKGIKLNTKVSVPPLIRMSDTDLVSVISNLTDNAIEAVTRENIENGEITASIRYQRGYLFVKVENPVNGDLTDAEREQLRTSKSSDLHGWGTKIVKRIAEKYNGLSRFTSSGGVFTADVMLAVPETEELEDAEVTSNGKN